MVEKRWKRNERRQAEMLGGERVPITGRQRGSAPDIKHAWLAIESKSRKAIPGWLREAMEQAEASKRENQLPVAIVHTVGERHPQDLIVMRLGDFIDWFCGGTVVDDVVP